jgi:hypothetical protein
MVKYLSAEIELGIRSRDLEAYRKVVAEFEVAQKEFRDLEKEVGYSTQILGALMAWCRLDTDEAKLTQVAASGSAEGRKSGWMHN